MVEMVGAEDANAVVVVGADDGAHDGADDGADDGAAVGVSVKGISS